MRIKAAGRTLTVGELREALAGRLDDEHLVVTVGLDVFEIRAMDALALEVDEIDLEHQHCEEIDCTGF
jgi:hypothetical protein